MNFDDFPKVSTERQARALAVARITAPIADLFDRLMLPRERGQREKWKALRAATAAYLQRPERDKYEAWWEALLKCSGGATFNRWFATANRLLNEINPDRAGYDLVELEELGRVIREALVAGDDKALSALDVHRGY